MNSHVITPLVKNGNKPNCLIVFKFSAPWNRPLLMKWSLAYTTFHVYADELLRMHGSNGLIKHLNKLVEDIHANVVLFDIDFYPSIDFDVISHVSSSPKKIAFSFDDLVQHDHNSITAWACDLVLSSDPIAILRYKEKDMDAEYMASEGSKDLYFDRRLPRDIDVLHFGSLDKADRREFVEYLLAKNISVKTIGAGSSFVPAEALPEYISRAKIVINFAKTDYLANANLDTDRVHQYYLQLKGRVIEAGLCGAACVSEFSPAMALQYSDQEVPMFRTKDECCALISRLLNDDIARNGFAENLRRKVSAEFEDQAQIDKIKKTIDELARRDRLPIRVPMTYRRKVLRRKISPVIRSPRLVLREIVSALKATIPLSLGQKIQLICETAIWIAWLIISRIAIKVTRQGVAR